jgi:hypothetical protein
MQRVFVSIMAGSVRDEELTVIRLLIDFIYYAQFQKNKTKTLAVLQRPLEVFHKHKDVLIKLGIQEHFNIPKFHNIQHYVASIMALEVWMAIIQSFLSGYISISQKMLTMPAINEIIWSKWRCGCKGRMQSASDECIFRGSSLRLTRIWRI